MPETTTTADMTKRILESFAVKTPANPPAPAGLKYLDYQKAGIHLASRRGNALVADEMGLGKTITALGTINNTRSDRVLVVSPKSLTDNWKQESEKWLIDAPPIYPVTANTRRWRVPDEGPAVAIISYSQLPKWRDELRNAEWDMVVLDESHRIGNPTNAESQEIIGCIQDACATRIKNDLEDGDDRRDPATQGLGPIEADRKLLLTGTPFRNRPDGLFTQAAYLDPEHWGNPLSRDDRLTFNRRYMTVNEYGRPDGKNLGELQDRLRGTVMIRRLKDDVLNLPAKNREITVIPAEGDKALRHEKNLLEAAESGHKFSFQETATARALAAELKAPTVGRHVAQVAKTEPVVVFAHHQATINGMIPELEAAGLRYVVIDGQTSDNERARAVRDFKAGKSDVFIGTLNAASEGLTLTNSHRLMFAELDWTPTTIMQAEDRVHRMGQDKPVTIEYLVLTPSIDANMSEVMGEKLRSMDAALGLSRSAQFIPVEVTGEQGVVEGEADQAQGGPTGPGTPREAVQRDFRNLGPDEAVWANRLAREQVICEEYRGKDRDDVKSDIASLEARLDKLEQVSGIDLDGLPDNTVALSLQRDGGVKALTARLDTGERPQVQLQVEEEDHIRSVEPEDLQGMAPGPAEDEGTGQQADDFYEAGEHPPARPGPGDVGDDEVAFTEAADQGRKAALDLPLEGKRWEDMSMAERRRVVVAINDTLQRLAVARALQAKTSRGMRMERAVNDLCDAAEEAWTELVQHSELIAPNPNTLASPRQVAWFVKGISPEDITRSPSDLAMHREAGPTRLPVIAVPSKVMAGSRRSPFLTRTDTRELNRAGVTPVAVTLEVSAPEAGSPVAVTTNVPDLLPDNSGTTRNRPQKGLPALSTGAKPKREPRRRHPFLRGKEARR